MAALTTALLALTAAQTASSFMGQRKAANATQAQGDYQGGVYDQNAALSDQQATDAIARGRLGESRYRSSVDDTLGQQRVGYAGQGVALDSGTAGRIQSETQTTGNFDALTLRNNAMLEAHGFKVQADQDRQAATFARAAGGNAAGAARLQSWGTLLTGGAQAVGIARDAGLFSRGASGGSSLRAPSVPKALPPNQRYG